MQIQDVNYFMPFGNKIPLCELVFTQHTLDWSFHVEKQWRLSQPCCLLGCELKCLSPTGVMIEGAKKSLSFLSQQQ
jgi:hypothetical protein